MNQNSQHNAHTAWYAAILLLHLLLVSCSLMTDDRSGCPDCHNPLRITLRYDYNTARANMFSDHVEQATVYLVDSRTNTVVETQTAANTAEAQPLRSPMFAFNVEGLMPGYYHLYATGRSAADAAIQLTKPTVGEAMGELQFMLPIDAEGNVTTGRLDTLWNTLQPVNIVIPEQGITEAVVPLMRLTNDLNVLIFRCDTPAVNSHVLYDVSVIDDFPVLGSNNEPVVTQQTTYRPFAAWTTETLASDNTAGKDTVVTRDAHFDLSLFRLFSDEDVRRNPRLIIRNRENGTEVVNINLCHYLSLARNAYEIQHYSVQEYLDREYDYRLDFGLGKNNSGHDTWKYMTIRLGILSWSLRIQNEEL